MGFLVWGHSFLYHSSQSHTFSILHLSLLLFSFCFSFFCVGSMRDKYLKFVRNHLLYLLNATDLTLLNTLLAGTGHTEL